MSNTIKILIVDDEEVGRNLLEAILRPEGYELSFSINGKEALEVVAQHNPDIILCDVMMPLLDGFGVVRELRNNKGTAHIPLLLITALDDRESLIRGIESGADDYISKPFHRLEIIAKVKNHINLLQYRLGKVNPQITPDNVRSRKLDQALIQVLDDNFRLSADSEKSEIWRNGKDRDQDTCSIIQIGEISFYTHVSAIEPISNFVALGILIQKGIENLARRGMKSPDKLLSMVFEEIKILSSDIDLQGIGEDKLAIAIVSIDKLEGTCAASGINQKILADERTDSLLEANHRKLNIYNLKPGGNIQLKDWNYSFIVSSSAFTFIQEDTLVTQLNEHYTGDEERNIKSVFSDIFDQTHDLLILKLSI